jgi:hypothetical protein
MLVLSNGLAGPGCSAEGPHLTGFRLPDYKVLFNKDIRGDCYHTLVANDGLAYVISYFQTRIFEISTGEEKPELDFGGGRNAALLCGNLVLTKNNAQVIRLVDLRSRTSRASYDVMRGQSVRWIPATEGIVTVPDGRIFVTNRNNDELSIIQTGLRCK